MLDPALERKMDVIAEELFGTHDDPDQIPITKESGEKLETLTPHWITYRTDEAGDPIAWVVILPTTREHAQAFLQKRITEKQLLELTNPQEMYSALYLCAAVTVPEYRRKGIAFNLLKEGVEKISTTPDCILFAWPIGEGAIQGLLKLEQALGRKIYLRES